jgi:hypothetical protein
MPRIFEVFGYPVTDNSEEAKTSRALARCPFMSRDCDGGGNRYLSSIDLSKNSTLQALYPTRKTLHAGVCSIQLKENKSPWIVCPRRLLVLGREKIDVRTYQKQAESKILKFLGYSPGTLLGIWSEIKLTYISDSSIASAGNVEITPEEDSETLLRGKKYFDYTFDYLVMPLGKIAIEELSGKLATPEGLLIRTLEKAGYTLSSVNGNIYVDNFPIGTPNIIEIMTSSTSGGDKKKRTTIPMAFEDAISTGEHKAPGINYRQVWARMVSQLIVKSEVAKGWGGKTIWIVQDVLIDYINSTTALNIHQFLTQTPSEVNMLSFSYGNNHKNISGVVELEETKLYAGPISLTNSSSAETFQDIIRTPCQPPIEALVKILCKRKPMNAVAVL